ncbi:ATP dependent RNA helicase DDX42 [Trichuris trichiura]|uniref:RNA helicase n=1 Tax=Trichuris trichiura TaxID=36087 RepID=A0A077ZEM9_TRITR|nr:ATP dependent RNA helicase DDX42 [Trichuris trichiura]
MYKRSENSSYGKECQDDEEDPLDVFMAGIEAQAKKDKEKSEEHAKNEPVEEENKHKLANKDKLVSEEKDEADELDFDEEGNPLPPKKKYIDPLPAVDHTSIEYEPFEKNFYEEHSDIAALTSDEVKKLRQTFDIKVLGAYPPKPVTSFAHFGFDEQLMNVIRKSQFTQPTPIQAQGVPVVMSGRDIVGIAKTGSGKTAAYLWPALYHIMDQRDLQPNEGPICLIVVPTRELAIQVYNEARKYGKPYGLRVVCAYGGGSKWEQTKALQEGAEIVVCTPGRLIDLVKARATNLERVTYLVFDEADRMFDLGFEAQVRSIANHIRPDRQCLMFSATFKKKIERLSRDILSDPIKVIQGEIGEANTDIEQAVEVLPAGPAKWLWLTYNLVKFCSVGKVLIFVSQKLHAEELAKNLSGRDFRVCLLHGDLLQHERNEVIQAFRKEEIPILVATDVAARGLDIPSIKTVVNYDVARDADTHVHRIGRTGRAGEKGSAYTLVTEKDKEFAGHLVRSLEAVNQNVPKALLDLAMQSTWFRKTRFKKEKAKRPGIGGFGLGYTEKRKDAQRLSDEPTHGLVASSNTATSSGSSRLAAIKSAYASSYLNTFKQASADTAWDNKAHVATDPTPEWKKRIEAFRLAHIQPPSESSSAEGSPAPSSVCKKSRWE